ncbi:BQ5605_C001g00409 [Microbotryum silenes-dioicae]|uniref:BQ5605_C001g00409 protein n=1 Tax=Microbotryum silenes-dioicae TaxID=796604 RepID=A0A2X0M6N9_9BASI|nr:BQ5605_C001g00409 [Microbotryum silenes-dioicae]
MARDRLAAIRAQQAATDSQQQHQQNHSYPQQPQQQQLYGEYGRPSAEDNYGRPNMHRPPHESRNASFDDPGQYQSNPPYSRSRSNSSHGGSAARPRPSNPPPVSIAPSSNYMIPSYQEPPRDLNPYEPQAYSPIQAPAGQQPKAQKSQYTPLDPVRTRQRSISEGKLNPDQRRALEQSSMPPPPVPGQNYNSDKTRGYPNPPPEMRPAPSYQSFATEYDDYKGSSANLVSSKSRAEESYEMQKRRSNSNDSNRGGPSKKKKTVKRGDVEFEEMGQFFAEVSDLQERLREANGLVQQIAGVHARILALPSTEDPQSVALNQELNALTTSSRKLYNSLKNRILALDQGNAGLRALVPAAQSMYNLTMDDVDVRNTQVSALKERFKSAIQRYAEVERDNRNKNRSRMERQVMIVNPGLSAQEVNEVVRQAEEEGSNAVFSQALQQSDGRRGYAARGALREVETRAAALARIESTLVQLAQLFSDMAILVEEQDVQIVAIEAKAAEATHDMEKGLQQTQKAVKSARNARKWRWICFIIILIILIVVAVVVVIEVVLPMIKKNNEAKANAPAPTTAPATSTPIARFAAAAAITALPTASASTSAPTSTPARR